MSYSPQRAYTTIEIAAAKWNCLAHGERGPNTPKQLTTTTTTTARSGVRCVFYFILACWTLVCTLPKLKHGYNNNNSEKASKYLHWSCQYSNDLIQSTWCHPIVYYVWKHDVWISIERAPNPIASYRYVQQFWINMQTMPFGNETINTSQNVSEHKRCLCFKPLSFNR